MLRFKGSYDHAIQRPRYARFYFGLNCIGQEAVSTIGLHSFPIPFKRTDIVWARFKTFKTGPNYAGYKIRCDQEIKRMEHIISDNKYSETLKMLAESQLVILKYIGEGPYAPNRL